MRARAGLILLAASWLVLAPACARRPPAAAAAPVALPFAASFKATVSGPSGRLRLAGVLAAGPSGLLRVEIARGGESFLLVSAAGSQTASLSSESIFMEETGGADLIAGITGTAIGAPEISAALRGDAGSGIGACRLHAGRWRPRGGSARIPTRIRLECGEDRLKLKMEDPVLLAPGRAEAAFAPLEPPRGYDRVDAQGMSRAIREALGGR